MTCSNPKCVDGRVPCPHCVDMWCGLETFRPSLCPFSGRTWDKTIGCTIPCPECAERVPCETCGGTRKVMTPTISYRDGQAIEGKDVEANCPECAEREPCATLNSNRRCALHGKPGDPVCPDDADDRCTVPREPCPTFYPDELGVCSGPKGTFERCPEGAECDETVEPGENPCTVPREPCGHGTGESPVDLNHECPRCNTFHETAEQANGCCTVPTSDGGGGDDAMDDVEGLPLDQLAYGLVEAAGEVFANDQRRG